ncbi:MULTISPECIES: hypothetical protein [unclassified Photorhabdus]|nr:MULTISPECIES: hypothetical protein [unclassified Photorhabdus]
MKNEISELKREKDQADINAEQQAIALLKIAMHLEIHRVYI